MKRLSMLAIFMCISCTTYSQSISIAPASMQILGRIDYVGLVSFEYKSLGVHYFHAYDPKLFGYYENGELVKRGYSQSSLALSFIPIDIRDIIRLGVLGSLKKFPTTKCTRVNIWAEAGINYKMFRLSFIHMSNGFGLFNKNNPGFDTIRLTVNIN